MQLHAEEAVSAHMANHKKIFNQSRIIKRSFCQHFLCRNSKILNQLKSSNRWAVMKSLDKSEEEIIKSFSEKQNDCLFLERRKRYHHDPIRPLGITSTFTIRIDGNGTTNR
jgi:penicillin-binding protein 1A